MKMGPNDAEIIRVYTREPGSPVADFTLDASKPGEVVVEVQSGITLFGSGPHFRLGFMVKDLETGASLPYVPAAATGHMATPTWPTPSHAFVYTISPGTLAAHEGHLCRIYAYLLVGSVVGSYDYSFVESPLFLIIK
jgi:hypothetical protein